MWRQVIPQNTGGGRKKQAPTATLYASGQLTFSHATVEMLGAPEKVTLHVDTEAARFRLKPSTPDDRGAFSLAGGGNSQSRISARQLVHDRPELVGAYIASRIAGGIELSKAASEEE